MKISIKLLVITLFLISGFSACKKGSTGPDPIIPDTTKPTITIIKPTAGQIFSAGSTIVFQASFSDNVKLKSYEIAISKVITGGLILKIVPISEDFSYTKTSTNFTAGVKLQEINLSDIVIPVNTANKITTPGKYNVKVTCVDASDNSNSTTIEINIS